LAILFDQIKNQHYSLLDSRFKGHPDLQDGINALFESLKELPKTEGIPNEQVTYLHEINLFWGVFYQELQEEKITSQDEKYQIFRRMGQKLQRHAYYDVAVDLLHVATFGWSISLTIHYDILVKWKTLADDMRALRRCCNEIKQLNGRLKTQKTQKLLIETQGVVKKAQRSLKSSGNNSDEIRDAIKLLRNLDQNIPASKNGTILFSQTVIKKVKGVIDDGKAIFVYGDYIQFDQRGQTLNRPQTNIGGDVNGSVLPGNFNAPVTLDHRQVNTSGGDNVEKDKIDKSIHIDFNFSEWSKEGWDTVHSVLWTYLPNSPLPKQLFDTLGMFRELHQKLAEWKLIHNHLTLIISMSAPLIGMFEPFSNTPVIDEIDARVIKDQWRQVENKIYIYKEDCKKKVQNVCVQLYDGGQRGDPWIIEVINAYCSVRDMLNVQEKTIHRETGKFMLGEINVFHGVLMTHLERVDYELLGVANDIQEISQKAFKSFDFYKHPNIN